MLKFSDRMHNDGEEVWSIALSAAKKSVMTIIFALNAALKPLRAEPPTLLILPIRF